MSEKTTTTDSESSTLKQASFITDRKLSVILKDLLNLKNIPDVEYSLKDHSDEEWIFLFLNVRIWEEFQLDITPDRLSEFQTLTDLAAHIDHLRKDENPDYPEKKLILQPMVQGNIAPLSFPQQRLWVMDQIIDNYKGNNLSWVFHFIGTIDADKVFRAFEIITERHSALWTSFEKRNHHPVQIVHPAQPINAEWIDIPAQPGMDPHRRLQELLKEEHLKKIDLASPPLFRFVVFRLSETDHYIHFIQHHIVFDGWSLGIWMNEFIPIYRTLVDNNPLPELPPAEIRYSDFCIYNRKYYTGRILEEKLSFWKEHLWGDLPVLNLPMDRPRPPVQKGAGADYFFPVGSELATDLEAFSLKNGLTTFQAMLSVFYILLYRYTGQSDLIVGYTSANRTRDEIKPTIGFFVNMVPMRQEINPEMSYLDLAHNIREIAIKSKQFRDVPFDQVVNALNIAPDRSHNSIFQVMFGYQNFPFPRIELPDLELNIHPFDTGASQIDLAFIMDQIHGDQLMGNINYNTDLFDPWRMEAMARHYLRILKSVITSPDQRIDQIPLLDEEEFDLLVRKWNRSDHLPGTSEDKDRPEFYYDYIEKHTLTDPHGPALTYKNESITYLQLKETSDILAGLLLQCNVNKNDSVAILLERSAIFPAITTGIWKANCVYIPVDPSYPDERIRNILDESGISILITELSVLKNFQQNTVLPERVPIILLDSPEENHEIVHDLKSIGLNIVAGLKDASINDLPIPQPAFASDDPAYIIYTSGTTGKPKGIINTHGNVINLIRWSIRNLTLSPKDRVTQFASFSFDVSVAEIYPPLAAGAEVVILEQERRSSPVGYMDLLKDKKITVSSIPPALLYQLIDFIENNPSYRNNFRTVRRLICGGDALLAGMVERWQNLFPDGPDIMNVYGPTETTVLSTYFPVPHPVSPYPPIVPIGTPIDHTKIYILDENGSPCPVSVAGEICIGGAGVALGYANDPQKNKEKFMIDPFSHDGSRMYRTGDLGRWMPDGKVEFLGRTDHQVKIRGFRVELTEIESALISHTLVKDCITIAHKKENSEKQLVTYIIPETDAPGEDELKNILKKHLSSRLPDYMLPSVYIFIHEFPLTPNGKVDRKALPEPQWISSREFIEPQTETEIVLARIWIDLLKVERIGIYDNFFELGGHSLLATQVISRIREKTGADIQIQSLFENPVIKDLAARIESSSTSKDSVIRVVDRSGFLPLSFAQQRLWFIEEMLQGDSPYVSAVAIKLTGEFNIDLFNDCLMALTERHESLRTRFLNHNGEGAQLIESVINMALRVQEDILTDDRLNSRIQEALNEPMDISTAPLLRPHLFRVGIREHVLLLMIHHIITDGWSFGILLEELFTLYRAKSINDTLFQLPEKNIDYVDFAIWQRGFLSGDVMDRQISFWKDQLGGELPILELPTDHARPAIQKHEGKNIYFSIHSGKTSWLHTIAKQQDVTLFMVLLSVYYILLYRYTGQSDLIVGSPIANRNRNEIERIIGFFVNTLALRIHVDGRMTFEQLLRSVRGTTLAAYDHQDIPFEKLVEDLEVERDLSRNPIFQTMFVLQNAPLPSINIPNLHMEPLDLEAGTAHFDITFNLEEKDGEIRGVLNYNTALFDRWRMESMTEHFVQILDRLQQNPECPVGELDLLLDRDREILASTNRTEYPYQQNDTLITIFEKSVTGFQDRTALILNGDTLSYDRLNRRANQLARKIRERGVGPDDLVGIFCERSFELVIAVFATLKAGAGYLPLDVESPEERIDFILKDSEAKLILTQQKFLHSIRHRDNGINLDEEDLFTGDDTDLTPVHRLNHIAYCIYTSGSTGKPKGVLVEHRSILNLMEYLHKKYPLLENDRWLMKIRFTFDPTVMEVLSWFRHGGALVILPPGDEKDPVRILNTIRNNGVTHMLTVPSIFQAMVDNITDDDLDSLARLKLLYVGGEVFPPELARKFHRTISFQGNLINVYGPTETTIIVTGHRIEKNFRDTSIPIGKPFDNISTYIVNTSNQLQPSGIPGELCIAGECVARGYLNHPELSEKVFVENPFRPGERMYRTGDLVRLRKDGELEFLGRIDHQVKIRGQRIEPDEIKNVLLESDMVKDAVILVRESDIRGKFLVAYVTLLSSNDYENRKEELRDTLVRHLKSKLPDYMVPPTFVFLDTFPYNANGKLDVRSLPEPDDERDGFEEFVEPETKNEIILKEIWEDILGIDRIGIYDNFFSLGGHSLLATRVVSLIRERTGIEPSLQSLFTYPVLKELAEYMDSCDAKELSKIVRLKRENVMPLSFAQQRLWFIEEMLDGESPYISPLIIRLYGDLRTDLLKNCLEELAERHESLRTRIVNHHGEPMQIIEDRNPMDLHFHDLTEHPGDLESQIINLVRRSFDLSVAPPIRNHLFKTNDGVFVLLMVMHHIITDGWSYGILLKELFSLYEAKVANDTHFRLPEKSIDYVDFAIWQKNFLSGEEMERQSSYWKEILGGELPILELPTDHTRPAVQTHKGNFIAFTIDPGKTAWLQNIAKKRDVTLFMVMLSIYYILLYRYTGQSDLIVGSPIANRNRNELEDIIGFFANTLALRARIDGDMTFNSVLEHVRELSLGAYDHQDIPFEKLVEELGIERDLSRNPIFQTLFVLQNTTLTYSPFAGLRPEPFEMDFGAELFDITISMEEKDNEIRAAFNYNTALFEEWRIRAMGEHFLRIIECLQSDNTVNIGSLNLLTESEFDRLIFRWNQTDQPIPVNEKTGMPENFLSLFEKIVSEFPNKVAVLYGDERITYSELDDISNRIALLILDLTEKENDFVGIMLNRGILAPAAMLGAWKARCAYIPVDPEYPEERIATILDESGATVILSETEVLYNLAEDTELLDNRNIITMDSLFHHSTLTGRMVLQGAWKIRSLPQSRPLTEKLPTTPVKKEDPAYVIYTSGTTGKPKGIINSQGNVSNLIHWLKELFTDKAESRITQFASFSFDVSVAEIYPPLSMGASLVILSNDQRTSLIAYMETLLKQKVTITSIPPALLYQLIDLLEQDTNRKKYFSGIRTVISGGDALLSRDVERWQKLFPESPKMVNVYGPTETTVLSTYHPVPHPVNRERPVVSLGKPIDNTKIYILNDYGLPLPLSTIGEIYISGEGVALGYMNDPVKNSEKFIADPFTNDGSRMYRTGDLGRWNPDGTIDFIGRSDHQVKIRGFRIELPEIEATLMEQEEVKESLVLAHKKGSEEKRLVAYIVPSQPSAQRDEMQENRIISTLRSHVRSRLPEYMIPSMFLFMDEFPLTPNGKVDRKALPEPEWNDNRSFIPPRTELETRLANIFRETLDIPAVSIQDNFFEIGGHSLLLTKIISRIESEIHKTVSLQDFFVNPTVEGIAGIIETGDGGDTPVEAIRTIDPSREGILSEDIVLPSLPHGEFSDPRAVLLTGATGFLGAFLLDRLLSQTRADVYCLVRAEDIDSAMKRIRQTMEQYLLWNNSMENRIIPVLGDLAKHRLGLSDDDHVELTQKADIILHNGAHVNFIYPYSMLKAANVDSCEEILKIATEYKLKAVHFISTLSVFSSMDEADDGVISESARPTRVDLLFDGYSQSKWAGEKMMLEAQTRGLPVSIYRSGLITGSSETGAWTHTDMFARIIRGFIEFGNVPPVNVHYRLLPVNFVAHTVLHLALNYPTDNRVYHLDHPREIPLNSIVEYIRSFGYEIRTITYDEFINELHSIPDHPLAPLATTLDNPERGDTGDGNGEKDYSIGVRFDLSNTLRGIENSSIRFPEMNEKLFHLYLSYYLKMGHIPTPRQVTKPSSGNIQGS